MKILNAPEENDNWTCETVCDFCEAHVEVDRHDLKLDQHEERPYWICPIKWCQKENRFTNHMPAYVYAKLKSMSL